MQPDTIKPDNTGGSLPPLELKIEGIINAAESVRERIQADLPNHSGLAGAVDHIVAAALSAQKVSNQVKGIFSLHRLPALFLAAALLLLLAWTYWNFFHVSTLSIALAQRDTEDVLRLAAKTNRVRLKPSYVPGSREAAELVQAGKVDLAFVQGGMKIADHLPRLKTPAEEVVFFLTRAEKSNPAEIKKVITSLEGEGSHTVAQEFFAIWGATQVKYEHSWSDFTKGENTSIDPDIDAVFVVKDASDKSTISAIKILYQQGFALRQPYLGSQADELDYLEAFNLEAGYLSQEPAIPSDRLKTYRVPTFLVARTGLTPRLLGVAAHVFDSQPVSIADNEFAPTTNNAIEMFQGVDAFLGIIINIVLAFLALLGLEMMTYRKRFHELNSLVSLLSMLQSNKDILGVTDSALRHENLTYLSTVSDLLGLISAISGYYTQENSSLLYNNLSEVVHQRCDNLKLNIQLKILHSSIKLDRPTSFGKSPVI